jgi:23S rRNA (cytidine2498-2'-O)-methyltransferase
LRIATRATRLFCNLQKTNSSMSAYLGSLLVSAASTPQLLIKELAAHGYKASEWKSGWTRCTAATPRIPVGWAAQILPHAHSVQSSSGSALPKAIATHLRDRLTKLPAADRRKLRVHFVNSRAALRSGALLGAVVKATAAALPGTALPLHGRLAMDETLVQIAHVDNSCAAVSIVSPMCAPRAPEFASLLLMSPFPAGQARVHGDELSRHNDVSTAAGKLLHAELQLGARIGDGQRVLDLGCTPGSWSALALERGAIVDGVDRGEPEVKHERFTFHRADVKQFPVTHNHFDWLLSDVVDTVDEIRALAHRWLAPKRRVVLDSAAQFCFHAQASTAARRGARVGGDGARGGGVDGRTDAASLACVTWRR